MSRPSQRSALARLRRTAGGAVALTLAAVLSGCAGTPGDGEVAMTLATPTWNAGVAPIAVAVERGYFEDEGLDTNIVLVDSGTTQVTQLGSGRVVTGAISPEPMMIGHQPEKDLDLKYYMSFYKENIYGLAVPEDSSIRSIEDLAGKKVGAISLASVSVTQAQVGLEEAGVDPDSVDFIAIGSGGQQAAAIRAGEVDAVALLDTSFQVLENQGVKLRMIDVPGTDQLTSGGLAARAGELEKNPELYEKIGRAVAKGVAFSVASPEAAIKVLYDAHPEARPTGLDDEQALASGVKVLESRLANLGTDAPEGSYGEIDPSMLQANEKFLVAAGLIKTEVPLDRLFTNDLIAAINDFDHESVRAEAVGYDD